MGSAYRRFEPDRNEPCICGSQTKFKKCCAGRYQDPDNLSAARVAEQQGRHRDALVHLRACFTQYVIWHRAHTVPFLASSSDRAKEILEIDVSALSELLDQMMECYRQLGELQAFRQGLESIASLIDHPRWRQWLVYLRTLSVLAGSWKEEEGRALLAELEPIEDVQDSEVLELYLDLFASDLGVGKRLTLIDRIVEADRAPAVRLQYRSLKGLQLLLVADRAGAASELRDAIAEYRKRRGPDDSYGSLQLARSCALLAGLTDESTLLEESGRLLKGLLASGGFTSPGMAMLWRDLGDVLLIQGKAEDARDAYLRGLDYADLAIGRIKVAKALTWVGAIERAGEYLDSVDYSALSSAEVFDFNTVAARIVLSSGDQRAAEEVATRFEKVQVRDPYFREVRAEVLDKLRNPRPLSADDTAGFFRRIWQMVGRYLLMQPSLFGFGVDVKAIVDDLTARRKASREGKPN